MTNSKVNLLTMLEYLLLTLGLLLQSFSECKACFSGNNETLELLDESAFFTHTCFCGKANFTSHDLMWIDPTGQEIKMRSTEKESLKTNHSSKQGSESKAYTELTARGLRLYIQGFNENLAGIYKCVTNHEGKKYVQSLHLKEKVPLYLINAVEKQYIIKDRESLITCQAKSKDFEKYWYFMKGEERIRLDDNNDGRHFVKDEGLLIKNVTDEDAGTYLCSVFNIISSDLYEAEINVEVMTTPVVLKLKATPGEAVISGNKLYIECVAEGSAELTYEWNKINETNLGANKRWVQITDNIIEIEIVQPEDSGTYECTAKNKAGESRNQIKIEVWFGPTITEFANFTAVEGFPLNITCIAEGRPRPTLQLISSFDYEYTGDNDNRYFQETLSDTQVLLTAVFINATRNQTGFYQCCAVNNVTSVYRYTYVDIMFQPDFLTPKEFIWGWEEKLVHFDCQHESNPPSQVTWSCYGNCQGDSYYDLMKTLNINAYETSWILSNGTLSGDYHCKAKNLIGEAEKIIQIREAFTPAQIVNVSAEITTKSMTFYIQGPIIHNETELLSNEGNITTEERTMFGPPIIGYIALYDDEERYNSTSVRLNRTWALTRPFTLDNLNIGTTYYVKFAAINEVGVGRWSDWFHFTTLNMSVPEKPEWIEFEGLNKNILLWNIPDSNGDPIDSFFIEYCTSEINTNGTANCKSVTLDSNVTEIDLQNELTFNRTYYLRLLAHNSVGYSKAAEKYISLEFDEDYDEEEHTKPKLLLSAPAIIGISVVAVFFCLLILDLLLLWCAKKGIVAKCCLRKKMDTSNDNNVHSRKSLLKEVAEPSPSSGDDDKRTEDKHKEYEYNKTTGLITGKHSAV